MKTLAFGLVLGALVVLLAFEPIVATGLALLALAGYLELGGLRRRVQALEAQVEIARYEPPVPSEPVARAVAAATTRVSSVAQTAHPMVSARRTDAPPDAAPRSPSAWDRWRSSSFAELEELIAGRLLAVVGGVALFLGGLFFLGLAFSRGWIGPEMRVAIGVVAGVGLFAVGGWLLRGARQIVAHVLVAVGIGVFSLAMFAATRLHGFFAPEFGVAAALALAVAAAALAVRYDAQLIAVFGLVAVLAAPPLMGASATLVTLLFIGAALAGTTAIALLRSWRWLPALAFVLAAPQLASYVLGDPPLAIGLAALGGFWLLNAISAAGEELVVRRFRLHPSSATLLLANAALVVVLGFALLDGDLERWRATYLLAVAMAHFALAAIFLVRESDRHPFGMLAAGTGIAAVTMAVPIQLGAAWVPLAWASEAVALAWIYAERRHRFAGMAALVLGILAAAHIVVIEYGLTAIVPQAADAVPFVNPSGMALGFVVLAAGLAIVLLRARHERIAVGATAAALVAFAVPYELTDIAEVLALTALGGAALVVQRAVLGIPLRLPASPTLASFSERGLYGAATVAGVALATAFFEALPVDAFLARAASTVIPEAWPFLTQTAAIAAIVAGGALVVGIANVGRWLPAGVLIAAAVIAYLLPFEVGGAVAVVGWAALAVALAAGSRWFGRTLAVGSRCLAAVAIIATLVVAAPVDRLWVSAEDAGTAAILNVGVLAASAVAAMLVALALVAASERDRRWATYAAGPAAVYVVSVMLVDAFAVQVGGDVPLEELQKQAQVALSVVWAMIGVGATVVGLRIGSAALRVFGLALLGVVTVKVFVIDLAALDIAYRVLSFVALGVLLLAAAYLYGRVMPRGPTGSPSRTPPG